MGAANLNQIFSRLNGITPYHPLSAETYADWSLEAGDIVQLSRDGVAYSAPVHSSTLRWNGSQKISLLSEGNRERDPISAVSQMKYSTGRGGSGGMRNSQQLNWEMTSEDGKLSASIKANEEQLVSEYLDNTKHLGSKFEQTATKVGMSVGEVTVDPDDIVVVQKLPTTPATGNENKVHKVGDNYYIWKDGRWRSVTIDRANNGAYYIKAGEIAIAINEDGSTTGRINANRVYLGTISDYDFTDLQAFAGNAASKNGVFADFLYTRGLSAEELNAKFAFISDLTLEGLTIDKDDSEHPGNINVEGTVFSSRLALYDDTYGIYFSGNTETTGNYAPHSLTINDVEQAKFLGTADVSFNRATSLSPAWGTWSSGETSNTLTIESDYDNLSHEIVFGGSYNASKTTIEVVKGSSTEIETVLGVKQLAVPIEVKSLNSGQTASTLQYEKNINLSTTDMKLESKTGSNKVSISSVSQIIAPSNDKMGMISVEIDALAVLNSVTVDRVALADNYTKITPGSGDTRTGIFIQGTASNGKKKDDTQFLLGYNVNGSQETINGLTSTHYYVTLMGPGQSAQGVWGNNELIGRINIDAIYQKGYSTGNANRGAEVNNGCVQAQETAPSSSATNKKTLDNYDKWYLITPMYEKADRTFASETDSTRKFYIKTPADRYENGVNAGFNSTFLYDINNASIYAGDKQSALDNPQSVSYGTTYVIGGTTSGSSVIRLRAASWRIPTPTAYRKTIGVTANGIEAYIYSKKSDGEWYTEPDGVVTYHGNVTLYNAAGTKKYVLSEKTPSWSWDANTKTSDDVWIESV